MGQLAFPSPDEPVRDRPRLPGWLWCILTLVFFPSGVFVGFGLVKVLKWPWSATLALCSAATTIGFAQLMSTLEENHASDIWRLAALCGGLTIFAAWAIAIYSIGKSASFWTPDALRAWRRAAWILGSILLILGVLTAVLILANALLTKQRF